MMEKDTIIVSPSGNFYGSEQVLYNFLSNTRKKFKVYVPTGSVLYNQLKDFKNHELIGFQSIKVLYLEIFFSFLFGSYKTLYINEGGHVKYAKLLANFLKNIRVVLHIRLLEDCRSSRLGQLPSNLFLVSISDYISSNLNNSSHYKIYDPLDTSSIKIKEFKKDSSKFYIGIIGRVSKSKGLRYYREFFEYISSRSFSNPVEFQFYGDIIQKDEETLAFYKTYHEHTDLPIVFKGFENNQEELYSRLSLVLHLNPNEPLGRIGLESWARGIPFVCFNSGGTGEINRRLGMDGYSISYNEDWKESLKVLIQKLVTDTNPDDFEKAKAGVAEFFSVSRYVSELEQLFKS